MATEEHYILHRVNKYQKTYWLLTRLPTMGTEKLYIQLPYLMITSQMEKVILSPFDST